MTGVDSPSPRVALLTYSTKPRGGVVHTLNLAEAMARLGVDVTVWSLARGGDEGFFRAVDPTVTLRLVPFADRENETITERIVRSIDTLRDAFDPGDYDIVHAQDCISANAVGTCIRTIHHLDQFTTPILVECHEKAVVNPYARICVSRAVADEVQQGWGLTADVIPNGVAYQRFADAGSEAAEAVEARHRWTAKLGEYVLAVGGVEPRKGSIDLLNAYALLRERHPELTLVFAGGETLFDYRDYRAEFDRRRAELDVEPIVLGNVPDDELPSLVAASRVFAFPSVKEGFGLAAMEALAAGRPVVARELPILREVFGDTVTYASTVPELADALAEALTPDPARVEAGRALAASLTWEDAARRHLEFYARHPLPRDPMPAHLDARR
ncbi:MULTISPECIES: MSMEG_0565 family glycosyltransferase [Gordonia]|uniref:MSMEG_0565 family glycosyltransferase n=1 Tax=Gordonia amicalis TaxID=89053 RepID=A0AAE4UCC8_9ACTN|nr:MULTISPECIES: MSMEG_0565 family glycosyltransferase [Gordonia]ATD70940.1 glycosyl transferase family 1 [Gordonia sp. 1D]KAF0969900.1 D-inositol 3-phosphate glycosyltransferase [Gordonia sp. YY1]MCZ0913103.1 MSMEG_0565 family glycosyltransferase [Gordonia amicalis]MCZ4580331.1 MSMEG_0565 family glycosyltransferase [Gordonia amicalis]MCZ4653077.1 MSMEG_0565 family glycosyltransferase [Gordonia amicalis]